MDFFAPKTLTVVPWSASFTGHDRVISLHTATFYEGVSKVTEMFSKSISELRTVSCK